MASLYKNILSLLNFNQKIKIIIVFILTILVSLLETVGIGFLAYFISLIADVENVLEKAPIKYFNFFFVNKDTNSIIGTFLFILILFFVLKNILIFLFHFFTNKIKFSIEFNLVTKLISKYLSKNYNFFIINDKSKIINYIKEETKRANMVIFGLVNLIKEVILIAILTSSILLMNLNNSLLVILPMFVMSFLIYRFLKNTLIKVGKLQTTSLNQLFKNIYEIMDGIKLLKLRRLENKFFLKIKSSYKDYFKVMFISSYIVPIPRLLLEVLGVGGLCSIIFFYISSGYDFSDILPTITFMALAIIRLVPSISALNSSFNTITNHKISIENICNEIKNKNFLENKLNDNKNNPLKNKINNLKIKDLSFNYLGSNQKALNKINLEFKKNEIIGVLGKSGSGKSTLMDILSGLLKFSDGEIIINNDNENAYENFTSGIGYVPQNNFIFDTSLADNVALESNDKEIDHQKVAHAINVTGLDKEISNDRLLGTSGEKISGGQKQRIGVSRVYYQNPSLLIFDEATSSIDIEAERKIMENIYSQKNEKIILIVAHRLSTLNICDKLLILENGKVKDFDTKKNILERHQYLRDYIEPKD